MSAPSTSLESLLADDLIDVKRELTPAQQADRTAAISKGASQRKRGGKELVAKAAAGDEAAQAESKRKARAGLAPCEAGQAASGAGCGKGGNSTRKLTEAELDKLDKEEGVEICKCSNCDARGVKGRQHWKPWAGRALGEKREMCGRYVA